MSPQEVEKLAKKYEGIPYKHLGTDIKNGIDCFNLSRYILVNELGYTIPYFSYDFCSDEEESWYSKITNNPMYKVANDLNKGWKKVSIKDMEAFDIIIMSLGSTNCINHCALYLGNNKMLQTMVGHKSWITRYGSFYKNYTEGVYRWIGLQN